MIPAHKADAVLHNGISRRAKVRPCPACGVPTLIGLDDPRCANEARADLLILTALGEALALLAGRSTYRLRNAGRTELDYRDRWQIAGKNADRDDVDVLAAHRCGAPPLPSKPKPEQQQSIKGDSDAIPF